MSSSNIKKKSSPPARKAPTRKPSTSKSSSTPTRRNGSSAKARLSRSNGNSSQGSLLSVKKKDDGFRGSSELKKSEEKSERVDTLKNSLFSSWGVDEKEKDAKTPSDSKESTESKSKDAKSPAESKENQPSAESNDTKPAPESKEKNKPAEAEAVNKASEPKETPKDPAQSKLETDLQQNLQRFAQSNPDGLNKLLEQAYPNATAEQRQELQKKMLEGSAELPKNLQFVDPAQLKGARGAYSPENGGTVSLSEDLLKNPELLGQVYAEEVGHHFDGGFDKGDAKGDEGQIFAEGLKKKGALDESRVQSLRSENDTGTMTTKDGRTVQVENSGGASDWTREFWDQPKGGHYKFMRSTLDRIASGELKADGPEVQAMRRIAERDPNWMLGFARNQAKDENFKSSDLAIDIAAGGLMKRNLEIDSTDWPLFVSGFSGGMENSSAIMQQALRADKPGAHQAMQDAVIRASAEHPGQVGVDMRMAALYGERGGPRSQVFLGKARDLVDAKSDGGKMLQSIIDQTKGGNDQRKVREIEQNQAQFQRDAAIINSDYNRRNPYGNSPYSALQSTYNQQPSAYATEAARRMSNNPESKYGEMLSSTKSHAQGHALQQAIDRPGARKRNQYGNPIRGDVRTEQTKFMQRRLDQQQQEYQASRSLAQEEQLTPERFGERMKDATPEQRKAMLDNITGGLYHEGRPNPANIEAMSQASEHLDQGQIRALAQAAYAGNDGSKATDMLLNGNFQQMDPQTQAKVVDWVNENGSFEQRLKARERFPDSPINISPQEWKDNMSAEVAGDILRDPSAWALGDAANEQGREQGAIQAYELNRMLKADNLPPHVRAAAEYLKNNRDAWSELAGDDNKLSRHELFNGTERSWSYNAEGGRTDSTHWMKDGVEYQKIKPPSEDGSYAYVERRRNTERSETKTQKWTPGGNGTDYLQDEVKETVESAALPYDVDGLKPLHNVRGTWSPQHLLERVRDGGEMFGVKRTVESRSRQGGIRGNRWENSTQTEDRYQKFDNNGRLVEEVRKQSNAVGDRQQPPRWVHRKRNGDNWDSQMFIQGTNDSVTVTHPRGESNAAGDARWQVELQDSFLPHTRRQIQEHNERSYRDMPVPERRQWDRTATLEKARRADLMQALEKNGFEGMADNPAIAEFLKQQGDNNFKIAISGSGSNSSANDDSTMVIEGQDGRRMVISHKDGKLGGMLELGENRRMMLAGDKGDVTTHELTYDPQSNQVSLYQFDEKGERGPKLHELSTELSTARNAFNLSQAALDLDKYPAIMAAAMKIGGRGLRTLTRGERALAQAAKLEKLSESLGKIKGIKGAEMVLGGAMAAMDTIELIDAIRRGDAEGAFRTAGALGVDAGATMTASANWLAGGSATTGRLATIAKVGKVAGVLGSGVGLVFGGKDLIDGIMDGDRDKIVGGGLGVAGSLGAMVGTIWGTSSWFGPAGWIVAAAATAGTLGWEGFKHTDNTRIGPPELLGNYY